MAKRLDLELLDEDDPFEIDDQAAHLFKHPHRSLDDIRDVWVSDPVFYPAKPPAHWLMVGRSAARFWWCCWHRPATAIQPDAAPSAATRLPNNLPTNTARTDEDEGETDDPAHDP